MNKKTLTTEEYAYSKLLGFTKVAYPKYVIGKMHEMIAMHLEAVESGAIRRLLIFSPPRHGKTLLASEMFPAWFLGRNPEWQVIWSTYNQKRGDDVGRKVRNLVDSDMHRSIFPDCEISQDSKSVSHFSTTQGGEYFNISVGGGATGRGANCLPAETTIDVKIGTEIKTIDIATLYLLLPNTKVKALSLDHNTNSLVYKQIIAKRRVLTNELYEITTDSGNIVRPTGDHKFFIHGQGYIKTKNLQKKNTVITKQKNMSYGTSQISMVRKISTNEIPVYDIQVEGTNNFFANSILCHNCFIIDDPHKGRKEVESATVRNDIKDWYKGVAYTRLMPDNRIVIINTRWHDDDLSGFVLKNYPHENWVILDLKAIAEENDVLGRKPGKALWPEAYPLESLNTIKSVVGPYEWNSQYQQHPVGKEGGMVKHAWIKRYSTLPEITKVVISWDTAFKDSEISDPSAATVWGMNGNAYYLLDVLNKRMEFTELKSKFQQLYNIHKANAVLVEDRASGQSLIQEMKMQTHIPVIAMSTKNVNKVLRFDAVTPLFESGKIFLPEEAHWLADYEYQITNFPSTEHDDMVDSTSQFLGWVNKPRYVKRPASKLYWK